MKPACVILLILLFSVLTFPQANEANESPDKRNVASTVDIPDCPAGKGCEIFKKLWRENNTDVRHARWVCFVTSDDFAPAGYASRLDSFLLLTSKPSTFFFDVYRRGTLSESAVAVLAIHRIRLSDATSWKPSVNSSGAMTVTLDSERLRITRKYQNIQHEPITFKFAMRLATGEFNATSTFLMGWTIHHNGRCTELPQDVLDVPHL
jgi:hypothetical protein